MAAFCVAMISFCYAQHENILYSDLGANLGLSKLPTTNESNSVGYELFNPTALEIGLTYSYLKKKDWVFEVSGSYRHYNLSNREIVKSEDIDSNRGVNGVLTFGPYNQYKLNTLFKYRFKNYPLKFGLGPELLIYPEDLVLGATVSGDEIIFTDNGFSKDGWAFLGITGELDYGIKTKHILFSIFMQYHWQPEDLYTVTVITNNLNVSPDTISKHTITGNYILLGIRLNPTKKLLGF